MCECDEIEPGELNSRLVEDFWPEDGHADHLGLKRVIEDEYEISVSLSTLKRHLDEHIRYSWGGGVA